MSADIRGNAAARKRAGELSPGEHLRAEIKRLGLDQIAASKAAGVSRQSINNIINDRQSISRAMAGKLARLTGRGSDYWLRDSFPAGQRAGKGGSPDDNGAARSLQSGILVDHQIVSAVSDGIIGIDPFAARSVKAASVELSLDDIVVTADGKKVDIRRGKGFLLAAGRFVSVSTKERIAFPRDYVGRVGALKQLVSAGIVTSHALQIEPGFDGHLHIGLFNAGGRQFRLRAGEPVIGVEVVRLAATPSDGRAVA